MTSPTSSPAPRTVPVALDAGRSYDVFIGAGVLGEVRTRLNALLGRAAPAFIVHDRGVPREHLASLESPPGQTGITYTPSEEHKSLDRAGTILVAMAQARVERSQPLIALGGGITGDVSGFAAGTYRRGIPWANCPTTLLAMVDASVGGKTGVNLVVDAPEGRAMLKNMVGVFHQPRLVVADVRTLRSLPDRELRGGLAECVKHALLAGDHRDLLLLEWIGSNLDRIKDRDEHVLVELVARNIAIKAAVVAGDEFESGHGPGGGRMALNLGHTFAHAFEAIPELGLSHGEAVGLGLLAAATCAHRLGRSGPELRHSLETLLGSGGIGLPTRAPSLPPADRVIALMLEDKKVDAGSLRLILPVLGRRVEVFARPPLDAVRAAVDSLRT